MIIKQRKWLAGPRSTSSSMASFTDDVTMESGTTAFLRSKAEYYYGTFMKAHAQVMVRQDHCRGRSFVRVSIGQWYFRMLSKSSGPVKLANNMQEISISELKSYNLSQFLGHTQYGG